DRVQLPEHLVLRIEVLRDRLDDQVAVLQVGELRRHRDTTQDLVACARLELPLLDRPAKALFDRRAPLLRELVVYLPHGRVVARLCADLGNTAAHEAAAKHCDLPDLRHPLLLYVALLRAAYAYASTITAIPCPPPIQAAPRPYRAPRRRSSWIRLIVIRAPDAASGCVIAIAPPFTFVFSWSRPSSRATAANCGANASFTSTRSMSSSVRPAFSSAFRLAGAGPIPMMLGSTPAMPHDTRRPIGLRPLRSAQARLATTHAAATSPMPLALPPLARPPFPKLRRSPASTSSVVSGRMCSSVLNSTSPLRVFTGIGATSTSKRPSSHACFARCCERSATSSASWRVTPYCSASFSAVCAIDSPHCGSV